MWHLNGKPLPVQVEAIRRLEANPRRYGLWMDMGTGKTAVALNDFVSFAMHHDEAVGLILCPNSLKSNWIDVEPKKWGLKHPVYNWKEYWRQLKGNKYVQLVMNYEAVLTNEGDAFFSYLALSPVPIHVALDESQAIKNYTSKTSKTVRELLKSESVKRVILLSGTPMTQNPMDLYPQLRALGQYGGMSPVNFRARFCRMGGFKNKQIVGIDKNNEPELLSSLARVSWRASKKDWLDIPEKLEPVTVDIKMTEEQTKLYRQMMEDFIVQVEEQEIPANMVISQLLKLQQISRGFIYDENGVTRHITDPARDPATRALIDLVEQTDKMVVMCHFKAAVDRLTAAFINENISFSVLRGGMKPEEIEEAKKRFNDGNARVIIGQLSAASKGHTLIGSKERPCFTLSFFENNYNLGDRMQAEDRINRIGQENACMYYDLAASPQDRRVIKALQKKKFDVDAIVEAIRGK